MQLGRKLAGAGGKEERGKRKRVWWQVSRRSNEVSERCAAGEEVQVGREVGEDVGWVEGR